MKSWGLRVTGKTLLKVSFGKMKKIYAIIIDHIYSVVHIRSTYVRTIILSGPNTLLNSMKGIVICSA